MCIDLPVSQFINQIGHDGSAIFWPRLAEPYKRRCFHLQECIDAAVHFGYGLTEIEQSPLLSGHPCETAICPYSNPGLRFLKYLKTKTGIIFSSEGNKRHIYACDKGVLYDPGTGKTRPLNVQVDAYYLIHGGGDKCFSPTRQKDNT